MTEQNTKELRLKGGSFILDYLRKFSATEKVLFALLFMAALFATLSMLFSISDRYMVEIPARGGSLNEGVAGLPRTINPILAVTDVDRDLTALVYSGLMKYENDALVPDIAESYSISDDGLTYDFILKEDVRFQDGQKLTADDIAFTIQKIQDPAIKSPRKSDWANISVKVISPAEVQFLLKTPYAPFLNNTTIGILPKHIWNAFDENQFLFSEFNTEPVGTGPYKISNVKKDGKGIPSSISLTTWRAYYGDKPYLSKIHLYFFNDEETAVKALTSKSIESMPAIPVMDAKNNSSFNIVSSPLPRIFGVFMNQSQNPVLADKSVRQALNISVDRNSIIEDVLGGYGSPLYGPLPLGAEDEGESMETDLEKAMDILEKGGWKKNELGIYEKKIGKDLTELAFSIYTADTPDLKKTAEIVKSGWNSIGARVDIKIFESGDLYQNVIRTRKYDALLFGEFIGKDRDLFAFWHSSQRTAPGLNIANYVNSKADKLLEDIRKTNNTEERTKKYDEFSSLVQEDIPAIFLYVPDFTYAIPEKIKGLELGTITLLSDRFNSVEDWYVKTEKVWKIFKDNKYLSILN